MRTRWKRKFWTTCDAALGSRLGPLTRPDEGPSTSQGPLVLPGAARMALGGPAEESGRLRVTLVLPGAALWPWVPGDIPKVVPRLCTAASPPSVPRAEPAPSASLWLRPARAGGRDGAAGEGPALAAAEKGRGEEPGPWSQVAKTVIVFGPHPFGVTWQRAAPAGIVLIKHIFPRSLGVSVGMSEPERGFLLPLGLGSRWISFVPSVVHSVTLWWVMLVENGPDAPRQVGQVRAARGNSSLRGPYSLTLIPSSSNWMCS